MRTPAEQVNQLFAQQVQAFAAELDDRARERFPALVNQALAAHGMAREQLAPREQAFVDAVMAAMLHITGEIVGLAMRRSSELVVAALEQARLGFPDGE